MPKEINKLQLNAGYWFLNHRAQIRRGGLIIFIIIDTIIVSVFLLNLITYLVNIPAQSRLVASMANEIIDYQSAHLKTQPNSLVISQEKVLLSPSQKYDFLVKIKNPNDRWIISSFQYRFSAGSLTTDWQSSYLANNEQKYLFYFGYEYGGSSTLLGEAVKVEIKEIIYKRILHPDKVPKLDFQIAKSEHTTLYVSGSDERVSQVKAEITNNSVYSFWQVGFQIVLYSNDDPVAINYTTIDNFDTLQTKNLDLKWQGRVAGVTEMTIVPEINIINDDNYKQYNIEL